MGVEWSEERAFGVVNGILSGLNLGSEECHLRGR